jgi:copper chaperone NosL
MAVSDKRFGAEIVTFKGKVYKFDDVQCLLSFITSANLTKNEIVNVYFVDFCAPHALVQEKESFLLKSDLFQSPMNGQIAAFSNKDSMEKVSNQYRASTVLWNQLHK